MNTDRWYYRVVQNAPDLIRSTASTACSGPVVLLACRVVLDDAHAAFSAGVALLDVQGRAAKAGWNRVQDSVQPVRIGDAAQGDRRHPRPG